VDSTESEKARDKWVEEAEKTNLIWPEDGQVDVAIKAWDAAIAWLEKRKQMKVNVTGAEHTQIKTSLKHVEVDEDMAKVVEWFNSFPEVYTIASCQGTDETGIQPYVLWFSLDLLEAQQVLGTICRKERTTVRYDRVRGVLAYHTKWPSHKYLKKIQASYQ